MKKILILGNSVAAIKAVEALREQDKESPVVLLTGEEMLPGRREMIPGLLAGTVPAKKLVYQPPDFYKDLGIEIIRKKVVRISVHRKYATTEDKQQVPFDVLVLAEMEADKWPAIKGTQRTGIHALRRQTDAEDIVSALPFVETIMVHSGTPWGLRAACALLKRQKEVIWMCPGPQILPDFLPASVAAAVQRRLEADGLRILLNSSIAEVLGDTEMRAVRLTSGKVVGADMLLFPDAPADLKMLFDTEIQIGEGIKVSKTLQTNLENIFAVDSLAEGCSPAFDSGFVQNLEDQGKALGAALTGQNVELSSGILSWSWTAGELAIQGIGATGGGEGVRVMEMLSLSETPVSGKVLFLREGTVIGALLVNKPDEGPVWTDAVRSGRVISDGELSEVPGGAGTAPQCHTAG